MKRQIFSNVSKPSLFEMAHKAGYKIKEAGYTADRRYAVTLDGKKMSSTEARTLILSQCEFYTFGNRPCEC